MSKKCVSCGTLNLEEAKVCHSCAQPFKDEKKEEERLRKIAREEAAAEYDARKKAAPVDDGEGE